MRRRMSRAELLARMPRAFRPRLTPTQLLELGLCHNINFAAITAGDADRQILWDYVGSVLSWWRAAQLLGAGLEEMDVQMQVATRLVARYARHGVVRFDGPDLQLAREGVVTMDQLATLIDWPTAMVVTEWGNAQVQQMAAGVPEPGGVPA